MNITKIKNKKCRRYEGAATVGLLVQKFLHDISLMWAVTVILVECRLGIESGSTPALPRLRTSIEKLHSGDFKTSRSGTNRQSHGTKVDLISCAKIC